MQLFVKQMQHTANAEELQRKTWLIINMQICSNALWIKMNTCYPHRKMMPSCQTRMTLSMRSSGASITKEIFLSAKHIYFAGHKWGQERILTWWLWWKHCWSCGTRSRYPVIIPLSVAYNHIGLSCFGLMVQWCGRKCSLQDSDMDLSSPLVYVDSLHRRPPWSRWTEHVDCWRKETSKNFLMCRFSLTSHNIGDRWRDPAYRQVYRKVFGVTSS